MMGHQEEGRANSSAQKTTGEETSEGGIYQSLAYRNGNGDGRM